jgi:hypothetical protein
MHTFTARKTGKRNATIWQAKAREGEALLQREIAPPAGVVDAGERSDWDFGRSNEFSVTVICAAISLQRGISVRCGRACTLSLQFLHTCVRLENDSQPRVHDHHQFQVNIGFDASLDLPTKNANRVIMPTTIAT